MNTGIILAFVFPFVVYTAGAVVPVDDESSLNIQERIIGGGPTRIFNAPFQVSIQKMIKDAKQGDDEQEDDEQADSKVAGTMEHFCGGCIINEQWVVTAAHCLSKINAKRVIVASGVRVWAGPRASENAYSEVEEVITHENFSMESKNSAPHSDIALMKLATPLKFGRRRQRAVLPVAGYELPVGSTVSVLGWGQYDRKGKELSSVLQNTELKIVDHEECKIIYGHIDITITDNMICAEAPKIGPCQGDEGGPLMAGDELVGIISWFEGCARRGFPTVFTKASAFVKWIHDHTKVHKVLTTDEASGDHP